MNPRCAWCGDDAGGPWCAAWQQLCESCHREAEYGPQGLPQMPAPVVVRDLPSRSRFGPTGRSDDQPLRLRVRRQRI